MAIRERDQRTQSNGHRPPLENGRPGTNGNSNVPARDVRGLPQYNPTTDAPRGNGHNGTNGHHRVPEMPPLSHLKKPGLLSRMLSRGRNALAQKARDGAAAGKERVLFHLGEARQAAREMGKAEQQKAYEKQQVRDYLDLEAQQHDPSYGMRVAHAKDVVLSILEAKPGYSQEELDTLQAIAIDLNKKANNAAHSLSAKTGFGKGRTYVAGRDKMLVLGRDRALIDLYTEQNPQYLKQEASNLRSGLIADEDLARFRYEHGYQGVLMGEGENVGRKHIQKVHKLPHEAQSAIENILINFHLAEYKSARKAKDASGRRENFDAINNIQKNHLSEHLGLILPLFVLLTYEPGYNKDEYYKLMQPIVFATADDLPHKVLSRKGKAGGMNY